MLHPYRIRNSSVPQNTGKMANIRRRFSRGRGGGGGVRARLLQGQQLPAGSDDDELWNYVWRLVEGGTQDRGKQALSLSNSSTMN